MLQLATLTLAALSLRGDASCLRLCIRYPNHHVRKRIEDECLQSGQEIERARVLGEEDPQHWHPKTHIVALRPIDSEERAALDRGAGGRGAAGSEHAQCICQAKDDGL